MFRKPKTNYLAVVMAFSLAVLFLSLVSDGAAQTDSASRAFKGSDEFRDAVDATASSIEKYANQLEKTDRSLDRLSRSEGDTAERYRTFAKDVRKLEKAHKDAVSSVERMRERETEYFTAWDKANIQIADPELRRSLAKRRSEVMSKYQLLADELRAIGRELQPLTSHLRDLDLFLGADATRGNLKEASEMIAGSRVEIRLLRHEIAGVQQVLRAFLNETLARS